MSHVRVEALRLAHPEGVEVSELVQLALNIARNCHWPVFLVATTKRHASPSARGGTASMMPHSI
jgi:hypothetical protein